MPNTYTPTPAVLTTVTEPVDGERRNAASVTLMTRALADAVILTQPRVTPLANLAALAAILVPTDGLVRFVDGYGLYVFRTAATTGLSPFRVAAGDATAGGWVSATAHETTKSVLVPCVHVRSITGSSSTPGPIDITGTLDFVPVEVTDTALNLQGFYSLVVYTGGSAVTFYAWMLPIDDFLIDGATLNSATLFLRPIGGHGGLPTEQPLLNIFRTPLTGYAPSPASFRSTGPGFQQLNAADVTAYQADQQLVYTPNQNNVINRTLYSYAAVIADESGTNALAGCRFAALRLDFTAIPDARRS